jgi:hypothetical protein
MTALARCCVAIAVLCVPLAATALANPVPSGPLKAYKGPEGELIVLVPVNDSKEMLVHFRNLGGTLDGKTLLYLFEDRGDDHQEVYVNKKRGSKTYRSYVLTDYRRSSWLFVNPEKTSSSFRVYYSETDSKNLKVDHIVDAYKP